VACRYYRHEQADTSEKATPVPRNAPHRALPLVSRIAASSERSCALARRPRTAGWDSSRAQIGVMCPRCAEFSCRASASEGQTVALHDGFVAGRARRLSLFNTIAPRATPKRAHVRSSSRPASQVGLCRQAQPAIALAWLWGIRQPASAARRRRFSWLAAHHSGQAADDHLRRPIGEGDRAIRRAVCLTCRSDVRRSASATPVTT